MIFCLLMCLTGISVTLAFPGGHLYNGGVYKPIKIPDYMEEALYAGEMAHRNDKMDRNVFEFDDDYMFVPVKRAKPMMREDELMMMMKNKPYHTPMKKPTRMRKKPFRKQQDMMLLKDQGMYVDMQEPKETMLMTE